MPYDPDLEAAHKHSSSHRAEVLSSTTCGCFDCLAVFSPLEIVDWVDEDDAGVGQCALCPRCGTDSVIGSSSGLPLDQEFLARMHEHWCNEPAPAKG